MIKYLTKKFGGQVIGLDIINDDPDKFVKNIKILMDLTFLLQVEEYLRVSMIS